MADGRQGRLTEVIESHGRIEALAVLNVEASADRRPMPRGPSRMVQAAELPLPYKLSLLGPHVRE